MIGKIEFNKTDEVNDNVDFDYEKYIVNPSKINKEISDFFYGRIKQGYKTGIRALDNHLVIKENEFYASVGKKGRGKTTINQVIHLMYSIACDLIWVVSYKENKDWSSKITIMNYILQDFAKDVEKTNPELYKKASNWVDEHFIFINVDDMKTATMICEGLIESGVKVHGLILDPVNSLDYGWSDTGNGHKDGVDSAKKLLKFSENVCSVHLSQHPTMFGQRKEGDISSFEAEGGWYFNKASYTYAINREDDDNISRINVENVRNKQTGGEPTKNGKEVTVNWSATNIDIGVNDEYLDKNVIGYLMRKHNPLKIDYEPHEDIPEEIAIPTMSPEDAFNDSVPF